MYCNKEQESAPPGFFFLFSGVEPRLLVLNLVTLRSPKGRERGFALCSTASSDLSSPLKMRACHCFPTFLVHVHSRPQARSLGELATTVPKTRHLLGRGSDLGSRLFLSGASSAPNDLVFLDSEFGFVSCITRNFRLGCKKSAYLEAKTALYAQP